MKGNRRGARGLAGKAITAFAVASLILASGSPASAANVTVYWGANYGSINAADSYWYEACDKERDGYGVYIDLQLYDYVMNAPWTPTHFYYGDSNGSSAGCGNGNAPHWQTFTWGFIAVCEDDGDGYRGTATTRDSGDDCSKYKGI